MIADPAVMEWVGVPVMVTFGETQLTVAVPEPVPVLPAESVTLAVATYVPPCGATNESEVPLVLVPLGSVKAEPLRVTAHE